MLWRASATSNALPHCSSTFIRDSTSPANTDPVIDRTMLGTVCAGQNLNSTLRLVSKRLTTKAISFAKRFVRSLSRSLRESFDLLLFVDFLRGDWKSGGSSCNPPSE